MSNHKLLTSEPKAGMSLRSELISDEPVRQRVQFYSSAAAELFFA